MHNAATDKQRGAFYYAAISFVCTLFVLGPIGALVVDWIEDGRALPVSSPTIPSAAPVAVPLPDQTITVVRAPAGGKTQARTIEPSPARSTATTPDVTTTLVPAASPVSATTQVSSPVQESLPVTSSVKPTEVRPETTSEIPSEAVPADIPVSS